MIRPNDSLTTPRPKDKEPNPSPSEIKPRDGSEGKSIIHLARDCLLVMMKSEVTATNVKNVAAGYQYIGS
jgi:hypothetical protein